MDYNGKGQGHKEFVEWDGVQVGRQQPLGVASAAVAAAGSGGVSCDSRPLRHATQAYSQTIAWLCTGNERYAQNAAKIIDAWSTTCTEFTGGWATACRPQGAAAPAPLGNAIHSQGRRPSQRVGQLHGTAAGWVGGCLPVRKPRSGHSQHAERTVCNAARPGLCTPPAPPPQARTRRWWQGGAAPACCAPWSY